MKLFNSHNLRLGPGEELDLFLNGKLRIIQSKNGYRFSVDAVLLADFATVRKGDVVVDLGTGCGVILLILLLKKEISYAVGIEIQKPLACQAYRNAILNGFQDKMYVIVGDVKRIPLVQGFADVVVCNPPYRKRGSGKINPDPCKAIARHELLISLDEIILSAKSILKKKGRLAMIYPAERMAEVIAKLKKYDFEPKRIQIAYPELSSRATLFMIEAYLNARPGLIIEPPIIDQNSRIIDNRLTYGNI